MNPAELGGAGMATKKPKCQVANGKKKKEVVSLPPGYHYRRDAAVAEKRCHFGGIPHAH